LTLDGLQTVQSVHACGRRVKEGLPQRYRLFFIF
jgi:hypothetical protein